MKARDEKGYAGRWGEEGEEERDEDVITPQVRNVLCEGSLHTSFYFLNRNELFLGPFSRLLFLLMSHTSFSLMVLTFSISGLDSHLPYLSLHVIPNLFPTRNMQIQWPFCSLDLSLNVALCTLPL